MEITVGGFASGQYGVPREESFFRGAVFDTTVLEVVEERRRCCFSSCCDAGGEDSSEEFVPNFSKGYRAKFRRER